MPASQHANPKSDIEISQAATKRRIVERLKRADAKVSDLAVALDMTEAGVRQHLDALADHGLVVSRTGPAEGRGRPPTVWTLTDLAEDLFPDRHDDLTVELITAVRTALGGRCPRSDPSLDHLRAEARVFRLVGDGFGGAP